jgi:hypothetical protein
MEQLKTGCRHHAAESRSADLPIGINMGQGEQRAIGRLRLFR